MFSRQEAFKSTLRQVRHLRTLALSLIAAAMAQAGTVNVSVTPGSDMFQYNYSIADGTGELAVLDIAVTPGTAITSITAPGGNGPSSPSNTAYDSVLGLVSFIENQGVFTATPESGFSFDSPVAPGPGTLNATLFDGGTQRGSVRGPVQSVAPEPASLALLVPGAAFLFCRRRYAPSRSV
jgi:hypothetical protein